MRIPLAMSCAALLAVACATEKSSGPPPVEVKATGVPGEAMATRTETLTVKVVAVDPYKRKLTVEGKNGDIETIAVGPEVKRLDEIAAGDSIQVQVTEGLLLEYQPAGTAGVAPTAVVAAERAGSDVPPGVAALGGLQATVTIVAIDKGSRVVTFQDADGNKYKVKAESKIPIEKLKIGDRLLATYVATVAIGVQKP
jgi:hypothetical protein